MIGCRVRDVTTHQANGGVLLHAPAEGGNAVLRHGLPLAVVPELVRDVTAVVGVATHDEAGLQEVQQLFK